MLLISSLWDFLAFNQPLMICRTFKGGLCLVVQGTEYWFLLISGWQVTSKHRSNGFRCFTG